MAASFRIVAVAILLLAAAALKAAGHHVSVMALLVLARGAFINTLQRDGEVAVGLTYMTGALVKFGQGLGAMIAGQRRSGWPLFLVLWLGLAGGALAGALAFLHIGAVAIWLAGLAAMLATLAAWVLARREVAAP